MGIYALKLPDLGEGVVESEVVAWYVTPGDAVVEDQHIADVMTDKATVEISSPVDGTVISLGCSAGQLLTVGSELIRFEVEGTGNTGDSPPSPLQATTTAQAAQNTEPAPQTRLSAPAPDANTGQPAAEPTRPRGDISPTPRYPHRTVLTSPSMRRMAREKGVDLSEVPGSGRDGRIQQRDLDIFLAHADSRQRTPRPPDEEAVTVTRIAGLRRVIARKIASAVRDIPHYTYIEEIDVTELEQLRQHLNARRQPPQSKLTLLPFIIRALVTALPRFPHCNATYDDQSGQLTQYRSVHAGIATMTDGGLMVPVVRHCERLDPWQCAAEIARVTAAARDHTISREELNHSTITITSLGALGGIATTPVINAPETTIIGINRMQSRPVVVDNTVVVRNMMNISASFDHRIVDGHDGALLVQALKELLETPATLFLQAP